MSFDLGTLGVLAALVSAASWALGAFLFKALGDDFDPFTMTLGKSLLSTVLLGIPLFLFSGFSVSPENLVWMALSGLLGIAVADTLFFSALRELSAQSMVVLLSVGQVFGAILAWIFLAERLSPEVLGCLAVIVAGVVLVLWPGRQEGGTRSSLRGIILGLLSAGCMAASLVMAKEALQTIPALEAAFLRMLAGFVGLSLWFVVTGARPLTDWKCFFSGRTARSLFLAVAVVTFGGFWLSLLAMKNLPVAVANALISTEPVFALFLAGILSREAVPGRAWVGAVLATLGAALLGVVHR